MQMANCGFIPEVSAPNPALFKDQLKSVEGRSEKGKKGNSEGELIREI